MSRSFQSSHIQYGDTGRYSRIVTDYIDRAPGLRDFYAFESSPAGIGAAIDSRKLHPVDRRLLVEQLRRQYAGLELTASVESNITALLGENTFTVCTAHQPNIFTGHLYFIYKILHAIRLAASLQERFPADRFVPVYFMGSEDHDLEELNHVVIDNKKYTWNTAQKGAVGRMKVDDPLLRMIGEIASRLLVEPCGGEIIALLKQCYQKNTSIERSTFLFVHRLFEDYGLVILLPDNASFKGKMTGIFEDDAFENKPYQVVSRTASDLARHYKVQMHPRPINLFYLKDQIRNRIVAKDGQYLVEDTAVVLDADGLRAEIREHPGHFSPNVVIRCLYQETILPNIAFIGGGGELAYWLELKGIFDHYRIPFPVLVLRNSFLIVDAKTGGRFQKLGIVAADLFQDEPRLLNDIVRRHTPHRLELDDEKSRFRQLYEAIAGVAGSIDPTLAVHTRALETQAVDRIESLEKKMLRAEKRKFADLGRQLEGVYRQLFPGGNLQERTENFMLFYARWGSDFIRALYEHSLSLEQQFCILGEKEAGDITGR